MVGARGVDGIEYSFMLHSLGISVVDNMNRVEIVYLYVSSTAIMWGEREKNDRFKKFKSDRITQIEDVFCKYNESKSKRQVVNPCFLVDKEDNFEVGLFSQLEKI